MLGPIQTSPRIASKYLLVILPGRFWWRHQSRNSDSSRQVDSATIRHPQWTR